MKRITSASRDGFTIVELMAAAAITIVILGSVAAATASLQRSFLGNRAYMKGSSDSARVVDYISQDLRNATGVSRNNAGVNTLLTFELFDITETDQLWITVPDYYTSNNPDNSSNSPYKTSRWSRTNLGERTYFPYDEIVKVVGVTRVPNYLGSLQIRYLKKRRAADQALCFYRMEYEGTTLRRTDEIAEKAEAMNIRISTVHPRRFQVSGNFSTRWSGENARKASAQFCTVALENYRTDLFK
jgi:type II secretory pathway component PulJ